MTAAQAAPAAEAAERVNLRIDDRGIATILFTRGSAGNAIDMQLATELESAILAVRDNPYVRVLVLRGAGKHFCVGGDVAGMAGAEEIDSFLNELAGAAHRSVLALHDLTVPVVAAVQGAAAGAGLGLVLAADYVVASSQSSYLTAYSGIALSPDCGVSAWLPRVVGLRRALRMLLHNERVDAARALDWELVDAVVSPEELDDAVDAAAARIAAGPWPALGETRRLARSAYDHTFADHLDVEAETITRVSRSEDTATAISLFRQRQRS